MSSDHPNPYSVLTSYPTRETRHWSTGHITCAKCGDKRQMRRVTTMGDPVSEYAWECRGCNQLWREPK